MSQDNAAAKGGRDLAMYFKLALAMLFLVFGGWCVYKGWDELVIIVKGTIGLFALMAGVVTLAMARQ